MTHTPEPNTIWTVKIGIMGSAALPSGADWPMRNAVEKAFKEVTGRDSEFAFSGWGAELTEPELAVIENRLPAVNARSGLNPEGVRDVVEALEWYADASNWCENWRDNNIPAKQDMGTLARAALAKVRVGV